MKSTKKKGWALTNSWLFKKTENDLKDIMIVSLLILFFLTSCDYSPEQSFASSQPATVGQASWYGGGEKLAIATASGETFDPNDLTAASWDYPFGTCLEVTNLANGKSVIVRINDRGPNKRLNRLIDLSKASFAKIAELKQGIIKVKIENLGKRVKFVGMRFTTVSTESGTVTNFAGLSSKSKDAHKR